MICYVSNKTRLGVFQYLRYIFVLSKDFDQVIFLDLYLLKAIVMQVRIDKLLRGKMTSLKSEQCELFTG